MPKQDNKSKEAIPSHPKAIARKLVTTDLSAFVVGPETRAGLKAFSSRLPVLRRDQPNNSPDENQNIFGGGATKDDTTRRADYELGQDEKAYHEGQPQYPVVGSSASKPVAKMVKKSLEINAQKKGSMATHNPSDYEASETQGNGTNTVQKRPKVKTKVPAEAKGKSLGESYLYELGEPMAPAPATSDSPGWSGDTGKDTSDNARKDSDSGDENKKNASGDIANEAKDHLENIATTAAEMYETISDDMELPSWVLEKLELAKNFVESVQQYVSENSGENSDDGDEDKEVKPDQQEKPTAFKGGKASMSNESVDYLVRKLLRK